MSDIIRTAPGNRRPQCHHQMGRISHAADCNLLSSLSSSFVEAASCGEIFNIAAGHLRVAMPHSAVLLSEYDRSTNSLTVRTCDAPHNSLAALQHILGRSPIAMRFDIDSNSALQQISQRPLRLLPGGLQQATFGQLPAELLAVLEAALSLPEVEAAALCAAGQLYGTLLILSQRDSGHEKRPLIQAIVDQTALALKAQHASLVCAGNHAQSLSCLAAGVAHGFRNQLTVIRGYGEMLLRRGYVLPEAAEKVQMILQAADRSAWIAEQLLSFSGQYQLQPSPLDLNDFLADVSKSLVALLEEKIRLKVVIQGRPCIVHLDAQQLGNCLIAMCCNAREAMAKGGELRLSVSCCRLEGDERNLTRRLPAGDYAVMAVSDNGGGIRPEAREKMFDPFFTTKDPGVHLGLGLSSVQGFVHNSGGALSVESVPSRGAEFSCYFPLQNAPVDV